VRIVMENQPDIQTFRDWLESKLNTEKTTPALIARFARLAMDVADREGCKKEEKSA